MHRFRKTFDQAIEVRSIRDAKVAVDLADNLAEAASRREVAWAHRYYKAAADYLDEAPRAARWPHRQRLADRAEAGQARTASHRRALVDDVIAGASLELEELEMGLIDTALDLQMATSRYGYTGSGHDLVEAQIASLRYEHLAEAVFTARGAAGLDDRDPSWPLAA